MTTYNAMRQKEYRQTLIKLHRCVVCRKKMPAEYTRKTCRLCLQVKNHLVNRRNEDLNQKGMCHVCGRNKSKQGRVICQQCKQRRANQWAERVTMYKSQHRCSICGADLPPERKFVRCQACANKHTQYMRDLTARRKEQNVCRDCGKGQPVAGTACCAECTEKRLARRKARKQELSAMLA